MRMGANYTSSCFHVKVINTTNRSEFFIYVQVEYYQWYLVVPGMLLYWFFYMNLDMNYLEILQMNIPTGRYDGVT